MGREVKKEITILGASYQPRGPCDWKNSIPIDRVKFSIHAIEIVNLRLKISIPTLIFPTEGALFSISIEMFNLDWKFQSEIGRLKVSIPERNLEIFQSLGPLGNGWSPNLGNGAEYCFESTVSEKRTHWASLSSGANSVSSAKNSVSSLWHTNNRLRGTHWVSSPELNEPQKNSLSSVFETVLSETVFGPSPIKLQGDKNLTPLSARKWSALGRWGHAQMGLDGLNRILTRFYLCSRVGVRLRPLKILDFKGFWPDLNRTLTVSG